MIFAFRVLIVVEIVEIVNKTIYIKLRRKLDILVIKIATVLRANCHKLCYCAHFLFVFALTLTPSRGPSLRLTAAVEIMNTQHRYHVPPHTRTDCRGLVAEPQWEKVTAICGKWQDGMMNGGRREKKEGPEVNKSND